MRIHMQPQDRLVLEHLARTGSISSVEAHSVHKVRSLSRRITTISKKIEEMANKRGDIASNPADRIRKERKRDTTGQRYVRYHLDRHVAQQLLDEVNP